MGAIGLASASNVFSYTATAAPGSNPDGMDQNSNTLQVWTEVLYAGGTNGTGDDGEDGSGVYEGSPAGSEFSGWQEYSYQNDGDALGGSVNSYNTFAGGALAIGQTVSINFEMRSTDPAGSGVSAGYPAGQVGVSLLNGSGTINTNGEPTSPAITFYVFGGGPGYYFYTDAGSTAADAGPMTYQYQSPF
ncbi:MAG TPA: hypothetical protein VKJ65_14105, partial [Phycisphaerae bacterium]|nr:hypothetical protein [Phycisphaerae bacterium]